MQYLDALILGIVQGLTEFLPVSSSGHLLLLEKLGVGEPSLLFNVLLHAGSLLAVVIFFFKPIKELFLHPFQKTTLYIVLATLPTVALALLFKYVFPAVLDGTFLGASFMLTAFLLFLSKLFERNKNELCPIDAKISLVAGVVQGIAVLPGISRSGATISALTLCGAEKKQAFEFSFLLSIPIIVGSAILEGADAAAHGAQSFNWAAAAIGMAAAFISGLIALKLFANLIKKHSLIPFAIYTFTLSVICLFVLH
jgi:undecaprenyl-diphosphatase